jgi:hypothetical protein
VFVLKKERFENVKKHFNYEKGGSLEACLIVREYLKSLDHPNAEFAVSYDEFMDATRILLAATWDSKEDKKIELHRCDNDCAKVGMTFCPGEFALQKRGKTLVKRECPFYVMEDK